ncbi:SRPBCC domain-containing protein [Niabella sp. W65]|nr:SRPBCC domain-containing protein [Niabella sp. W65]MCH7364733.1 SRPBCC domain-containing protein [Niabella sp. W65]
MNVSSSVTAAAATCPAIHHRLLIEKPPHVVYEALTTQAGLSAWWTPETIAQPEAGSVSRFQFGPDYFKELEIVQLVPDRLVQWQCLKGFEDWIGTVMTFELTAHDKGTVLTFHHEGWKAYSNELASCSFDWALFLRSLKFLCETGTGFPYPQFSKA